MIAYRKNRFLAPGLIVGALLLGACGPGGGYVGVGVDADYYGPIYNEPAYFGHPFYHHDTHFVSPPHQNWHPAAPARATHAAPAAHSAPHEHR